MKDKRTHYGSVDISSTENISVSAHWHPSLRVYLPSISGPYSRQGDKSDN